MKSKVERHIVLQIDELVLDGPLSAQRDLIAAAVEAELQRLLDEGGLPHSLATGSLPPKVQVNDIHVTARAEPEAVGAQIAASIYNNLSGNRTLSSSPGRSTE